MDLIWDPTVPRSDRFIVVQLAQWALFAFSAIIFWLIGNRITSQVWLKRITVCYLIVAAGGYEAIRRLRNGHSRVAARTGALGAALHAALVLLSLYNYYFGARFGREQWREAVALLESRSMSSDLVLLEPDYISGCYEYYQKKALTYWAMTPSRGDQIVAQRQGPVERLHQHSRVWLVRCHYENDRLLEALRTVFRQQESFVFPKAKGIEVYEFSR